LALGEPLEARVNRPSGRLRANRNRPSHRAFAAQTLTPHLDSQTSKGWNNMGFFSKDIKTMDDLFVHTLRDIYYAERQIVQGTGRFLVRKMVEQPTENGLSSSWIKRGQRRLSC
jgi:hypothetical protein